jgi:hypothetical protein
MAALNRNRWPLSAGIYEGFDIRVDLFYYPWAFSTIMDQRSMIFLSLSVISPNIETLFSKIWSEGAKKNE